MGNEPSRVRISQHISVSHHLAGNNEYASLNAFSLELTVMLTVARLKLVSSLQHLQKTELFDVAYSDHY